MRMFLFFACVSVFALGAEVTLSYGGSGLSCANELEFKFDLGDLVIKDIDDSLVSLSVDGWTNREIKEEADLPVLREFVALPQRGDWRVVVEDVVTVKHDLGGRRIIPSKGPLLLKQDPNEIPLIFGSEPKLATALLHPQHTMRDIPGTVLEINPIRYNRETFSLEIVVSCTVRLVTSMTASPWKAKLVDATFYDLYNFHYINFHHYAGTRYTKGDDLGRMYIFYDSKFEASAKAFAKTKTDLKDVLLAPCSGSADSLKALAKKAYGEADGLTYIVLFGRSCPTFNCQTSRRECDVKYAQMSADENDITLDVFVSRISANSQSEVDAQLGKFAAYTVMGQNKSVGDWSHQTAGLALDLIGDEYKFMHRNLDKMTAFGFTQATFMTDRSASSSQVNDLWNKGMGLYYYIGHGSGTKWNCPQSTGGMSEGDITSKLHNSKEYTFVLECSCLNGGFKQVTTCFAQAMMSKVDGGAISMYSSAPEAQSSSPKDLQSGATDAMTGKAATRVGPIYYAGIMYAYKLKPSQAKYTLEGYNMFGDPSLQLNFLK